MTIESSGTARPCTCRCRDPLAWTVERPAPDQVEVIAARRSRRCRGPVAQRRPRDSCGRRGRQEADRLVVTLRLGDGAGDHRAYTADGGRDVVVVLAADAGGEPARQPGPRRRGQVAIAPPPATGDDAASGRCGRWSSIPGHGGADTGAVGRQGIMEKDVNLAVARELKQYLERDR